MMPRWNVRIISLFSEYLLVLSNLELLTYLGREKSLLLQSLQIIVSGAPEYVLLQKFTLFAA
jgi:hypothetical protein